MCVCVWVRGQCGTFVAGREPTLTPLSTWRIFVYRYALVAKARRLTRSLDSETSVRGERSPIEGGKSFPRETELGFIKRSGIYLRKLASTLSASLLISSSIIYILVRTVECRLWWIIYLRQSRDVGSDFFFSLRSLNIANWTLSSEIYSLNIWHDILIWLCANVMSIETIQFP